MYDIWLIVENAIIPLISLAGIALNRLGINVINNNIINNNKNKQLLSNNIIKLSLIIKPKYTPAITIVELCDDAEIGLGADVAFDDQLVNGNWADLVKIIIIIGIE